MQRKMKVVLGAVLGKKLCVAGIVGVLALANACGPNESAPPLASTGSRIVGGVPVQNDDSITASAVLIENTTTGGRCTGTLISPDLVLTAAHCVVIEDRPNRPVPATNIMLLFGNVQADLDAQPPFARAAFGAPALQIVAHENYLKTRGALDAIDLALIQFKAKLPSGLRPAPLLPPKVVTTALERGKRVTAAGFGLISGHDKGRQVRLRKVDLRIDDLSRAEDVRLAPWGRDQEGICFGDSGGPAFVTVDETQYLWGVNVAVAPACGVYSINVNLSGFYDWLAEQSKALGSAIPGFDDDYIQRLLARKACIGYLGLEGYGQYWREEAEKFCQASPVLRDTQGSQRFGSCMRVLNFDDWTYSGTKMDAARICARPELIQNDVGTNPNFKTCWSALRPFLDREKLYALEICSDRAMRVPQAVWDNFPACWRRQNPFLRREQEHAISVCLKAE